MSERLSNKEVEDVLSSVRRLVSKQAGSAGDRVGAEMNHQAETQVEAEDAHEAEQIADEKLLLTPAFRVEDRETESEVKPVEDPEPPIETMDADDEALSATPDQSKGSVWSLEERIAELEAAVGGHVDEWEPDGSEDVSAEVPTSFPIPTAEPRDDGAHDVADAPDPEGEREEKADAAEDVAEDQPAEPVEAEAPAPPKEDTAEEDAAEAEATPEPPYVDMPGSNIVFAHQAPEAQSSADAQADAAETAEDGAEDATSAIELDDLTEEMLRDLVGDIVRDELQGALGERITRNVRKLVRREIQRALATGRIE